MQETEGTCPKHKVKFTLIEGCPQCLAERRQAGIRPEQDEMENGLNQEGLTLVGAEEPAVETAIALRPGADIEVMGYYDEAQGFLKYAEERVIATVEDSKAATDDLAQISKLKKVMENKRKSLLDPLKLQSEAIRSTYEYLMLPILEADKITRSKMLAYDAEQRRIRAEQDEINRLRIEAAQKEMDLKGELTESVDLVEVAPEPAKSISTDLGSAGTTDHWKYEIVDPLAVPREYLMVDTAMLSAIAKRHHDQKQVAGVRFYNEPIISVRAR